MPRTAIAIASAAAITLTLAGCAPSSFTASAGDLDVAVSVLERVDSLIEPGTEMCLLAVEITNTSGEQQDPNSLGLPVFYSADGQNLDRQLGHFYGPDEAIEHESGAVFYPDVEFPLAPGASATYLSGVECAALGDDGATVEFESESFQLTL